MPMPRLTLPVLAGLNGLFACAVIEYELHHLHDENSLLENAQALILGAGTAWFALTPRHDPARDLVYRSLAVLCFSFFLREVDVERLAIPDILRTLGSGSGRLLVLLLLWSAVMVGLWRFCRHAGPVPLWHASRPAAMAGVFVLFVVSLAMDKNWLSAQLPRLWEELAETNAYLLLVAGHLARVTRA